MGGKVIAAGQTVFVPPPLMMAPPMMMAPVPIVQPTVQFVPVAAATGYQRSAAMPIPIVANAGQSISGLWRPQETIGRLNMSGQNQSGNPMSPGNPSSPSAPGGSGGGGRGSGKRGTGGPVPVYAANGRTPLTGGPIDSSLSETVIQTINGAMGNHGRNMPTIYLAKKSTTSDKNGIVATSRKNETASRPNRIIQDLIKIAKTFYDKNWLLGTSGNLSQLLTRNPLRFVITAAGTDKGSLTPKSFVEVEPMSSKKTLVGHVRGPRPSGETALHTVIYQKTNAGSIVHVHSPDSLLIAELFLSKGEFAFSGFEVQKGLGSNNILEVCHLPIFENNADIRSLSQDVAARVKPDQIGVLIEKHGLFVWGKTAADAKRHVELLHHVFEYVLLKHQLKKRK